MNGVLKSIGIDIEKRFWKLFKCIRYLYLGVLGYIAVFSGFFFNLVLVKDNININVKNIWKYIINSVIDSLL